MLQARIMLNTPALLGAEQLLVFLGRMRVLQWVAERLSGFSPTVILPRCYCYGEHQKEGALKTVLAVSLVADCVC